MNDKQTVFLVDDDAGMRKSTSMLLKSAQLSVETYESAKDFLNSYDPSQTGCLLLDIRMPEMSGLELQEVLVSRSICLPVIVVSGHASVMDAVRAMKQGSFDFIEKPYSPELLLEKIKSALEHDLKARFIAHQVAPIRERLRNLTEREKQILSLVVSGKPSKWIADQTGISVSTVDNHRANIMKKLNVGTSAELVRITFLAEPNRGSLFGSIA